MRQVILVRENRVCSPRTPEKTKDNEKSDDVVDRMFLRESNFIVMKNFPVVPHQYRGYLSRKCMVRLGSSLNQCIRKIVSPLLEYSHTR